VHSDACVLRNDASDIVCVIRCLPEIGFTRVFTWLPLLQRNLYSVANYTLRTERDNLTITFFSYGYQINLFADSLLRLTSSCTRQKWQPDK